MKKQKHRLIALMLALLVGASPIASLGASATEAEAKDGSQSQVMTEEASYKREAAGALKRNRPGAIYRSLHTVGNKSIYSYNRYGISVGGRDVSGSALLINGEYYVPLRALANALGAGYSYDSATRVATFRASGLTLTAASGSYTVYANDRPLFAMTPSVIMNDSRLYITLSSFAKASGLAYSISGQRIRITGSLRPIKHASTYYRSDEVFWLARIIEAESRGEPLLGKIAVGNVVLNRVRSSSYPNTIYGVIFDRKYGVQFSPVLDGSIYNTPSYNSTLAAKICLEGFDTSDGALFFLRPETSESSWIPKNRVYVFSIGKHDFYK